MTKTRLLRAFFACFFFFPLINHLQAQDKTVTGTVKDESSAPIAGASIIVKGTKIGTSTGADGSFKITAPASATLVISFTGYEPQSIPLKSKTEISVVMHLDNSTLNSVV